MVAPLQSDPFKWTAAMSFTFLIHSIAFLSPLITEPDEPMWVNFKQHQRYLMGLMSWSASVKYIMMIDVQIREHQCGWMAIIPFRVLYRFKLHAVLHACKNWIENCPPRLGWCLKGEGCALWACACLIVVGCRGNEAARAKK